MAKVDIAQIQAKLDNLDELKLQRLEIENEKKQILESLIPPEIKTRIAEIEIDYHNKLLVADLGIADVGAEIESEVLKLKISVKGNFLHAIYNPGRISWNTKELDGAIKLFPALAKYRKTGDPYITIRKV